MDIISKNQEDEKNKQWQESFGTYHNQCIETFKKHGYKDPENSGTMPLEKTFHGDTYNLIRESHQAVCDTKQCQELFEYQDYKETGLSAMFYPILPIYTNPTKGELCALCIGVK